MNRPARAFTVTELLVVITLIVILVLIAVPSFSSMIYSSEEALAESQLRAAIRTARDVAIRSNGEGDGAAVFFFEPGGRLTIVPCARVGEFTDAVAGQATQTVRREVFAPAAGFTPISLPKYWMVRGFAPSSSLTADWFGGSATASSGLGTSERRWVFPETGFYDQSRGDDGGQRSTFMVRFRAGSGELVNTITEPALVLAPRPTATGRTPPAAPFNSDAYRADRAGVQDPIRFIRAVLTIPGGANTPANLKRQLIGRESSDMVLARPIRQIAMYNETKLAAAFGARIDRDTDCIYQGPPVNGSARNFSGYGPTYVGGGSKLLTMGDISKYMEGDTDLDGNAGEADGDAPEAKLFSIDRYTGLLRQMEIQR